MKRLFDFVCALLGILFLLPVMALVAFAVAIFLGRPVLFSQVRIGHKERRIRIYKFRTMTDGRDTSGELLPDKQRLTPFGLFLRKSSLDELPQLFNVLRGDLSLIGPRPLLVEYLPLYSSEQRRRHDVRPGITGWAQVNGRNAISWDEKFRLDVWYVDHWSMLLDLKILLLTIKKVIKRDDIAPAGQDTIEKFTGNQG